MMRMLKNMCAFNNALTKLYAMVRLLYRTYACNDA